MVRRRSAKPLFAGSTPAAASNSPASPRYQVTIEVNTTIRAVLFAPNRFPRDAVKGPVFALGLEVTRRVSLDLPAHEHAIEGALCSAVDRSEQLSAAA